jgi:hypothetical protein
MPGSRPAPDFQKVWSKDGIRGLVVGPARWTGIPLSMKGEKPGGATEPPAIPKHESSFLFFFRPIVPRLGELYLSGLPHLTWGRPHDDPDYQAMCDLLDERPASEWVPPGMFFPQFARYVGEGDWMDLYFVTEPPCSVEAWYSRLTTGSFVQKFLHTWIHNVDGAYWELFSKDQATLDAVRSRMRGLEGFYCEPAVMEPPG